MGCGAPTAWRRLRKRQQPQQCCNKAGSRPGQEQRPAQALCAAHPHCLLCADRLQGFLPSEWDPFFRDLLYPSFSPQMLLFLGMSSAYGLWKTGK